jgi:hypothetical protein
MAHTAFLDCFISTVNGRSKKAEKASEDVALVAGTQQNLSNLLFYVSYLEQGTLTKVEGSVQLTSTSA